MHSKLVKIIQYKNFLRLKILTKIIITLKLDFDLICKNNKPRKSIDKQTTN